MKLPILQLRPTQFVVGMREVENKIAKIASLKDEALKTWMEDHPVPCVIGPKGHHYLIDHHHYVAACYHSNLEKVSINIEGDKQALTPTAFWEFMQRAEWVYLYDQFGVGPQDPGRLPYDIRFMADDPYRSLAWELRQAGVIAKVQKPFAEFEWASWLRQHLPFDVHHEDWILIVKQAVTLAKARLASQPPGLT